jgi:hypothetical protein
MKPKLAHRQRFVVIGSKRLIDDLCVSFTFACADLPSRGVVRDLAGDSGGVFLASVYLD